MSKIKIAVVGAGNCCKSLVEGIAYYTRNPEETAGLMHPDISGYKVSDIEIVAAFDIDERKVGKNLNDAIAAEPNRTVRIDEPLPTSVIVQRGVTYDSVIEELRDYFIHESRLPSVDIGQVLRKSRAEMVVNYLPTGSDKAAYAYANAALEAGCGFVNCMPTPIGKDRRMQHVFRDRGLVLMGDDIKSQCGATIVNRVLLTLLKTRGGQITSSDQTNYGGNADHFNLHSRPESKEASKEAALGSVLGPDDAKPVARMIYTEKNYDHKQAIIKIKAKIFGGIPVSLDLTLEDEDSPNSGGVVVDVVRIARVLKEKNMAGQAREFCSSFMKSPPVQRSESEALEYLKDLI